MSGARPEPGRGDARGALGQPEDAAASELSDEVDEVNEAHEAPSADEARSAQEPDTFEVAGGAGAPGPAPGVRPPLVRRRLVTITAVAVAAVIVLGGGFLYRAWDTSVETDLAEATENLRVVVLELDDAVETSELVLASSEGRVRDDQVRVDLAAVASGVAQLSWTLPEGSRQARTVAATGLAGQARTHVSAIGTATAIVLTEVDAFELEQAVHLEEEATGRLALSIADARAVLDATAGQVLDDTVRVTLSDELASAEALAPTPVDAALAVAEQTQLRAAAAADLSQRADALDTARRAVVDAQVAWQAEPDRVAAERAAEAAQAAEAARAAEDARRAREQATSRPQTPGRSSGTNGPAPARPKSSGGTKAPATGGGGPAGPAPNAPAPAPAPAPSGGYTTETQTGTWCDSGDTSGEEGTGGWC